MNKTLTRRDQAAVARILNASPAPAHYTSPFVDLPEDVEADLRTLIEPVQARGLPLEVDPVMKACVGTIVEGQLFRIAVLTDPKTGGQRAAVLGPDLAEWERDTFLALLPDLDAPATPAIPTSVGLTTPMIERRHQSDILEEVLAVQRQCLEELKALKLLMGQTF